MLIFLEEGKECLTISNNNKDGRYLWYSNNCGKAVYFICELKMPGIPPNYIQTFVIRTLL